MERIVNYSSEDEYEESPKINAAERCPVLENDPNKRSKGDSSSRHPKEESTRDNNQGSSYHRDKEASHAPKKNSHKEDSSSRSSRPSSSKDQHYHRDDRRSERSHDKKRDLKDDRRRKESHRDRDRDRDYDRREHDRDRRDRSDRHRRDRYSKDNSYRDKGRRRRSSDSPTPNSKDHNTSSSRYRNRSRSRSPSKDQRTTNTSIISPAGGRPQKHEPKEDSLASTSLCQNKGQTNLQAVTCPPLADEAKKSSIVINKTDSAPIALPNYYNPNIINPTKYAEQVQKRKLIWGAKKAEDTSAKWGHATFSEDSDGKVASKFMRLMGIKSAPKPDDNATNDPAVEKKGPDVKSRQAMFSNMEQQYEVARQVTHTMRGVGLGFGSQTRQF